MEMNAQQQQSTSIILVFESSISEISLITSDKAEESKDLLWS